MVVGRMATGEASVKDQMLYRLAVQLAARGRDAGRGTHAGWPRAGLVLVPRPTPMLMNAPHSQSEAMLLCSRLEARLANMAAWCGRTSRSAHTYEHMEVDHLTFSD